MKQFSQELHSCNPCPALPINLLFAIQALLPCPPDTGRVGSHVQGGLIGKCALHSSSQITQRGHIAAVAHRRMWINLAGTLARSLEVVVRERVGGFCGVGSGIWAGLVRRPFVGWMRHGYRHEANASQRQRSDSKLSGFRLSAAYTHTPTPTHAHIVRHQ